MDTQDNAPLCGNPPQHLPDAELRLLFDNMISQFSYYKMIYDENGRPVDYVFVAVNKAFEAETGQKREQIIGKRALELYPATEQYWIDFFGNVAKTGIAGHFSNYSTVFNKWYDVHAYSPKPDHVAITLVNITDSVRKQEIIQQKANELNEKRKEIYRLAYQDPITKLPNRNLLMETAGGIISGDMNRTEQLAFVSIVLDDFPEIDASYGSLLSDQVLRAISKRMVACECEICTLYCFSRAGFILFVRKYEGIKQISTTVNKLIDTVSQPIDIDGNYFRLSAHCGISLYPKHGVSLDQLLTQANIALHRAKRSSGSAYAFYNNSMGQDLLNRSRVRSYLRKALDQKEFYLHYQPQISGFTREITGFEALIRWNSPELGQVMPGTFIPIAEESRSIIPIGEWVLFTACSAIRELNERFHTRYTVSVNISAVQLFQGEFVDSVLDTVERSGLSPDLLELEITESVFMSRDNPLIHKMNALRNHGVKFSLDDFGTGYSSLSSLYELAVSVLKIDRSFIARSDAKSLTRLIIEMGHCLNVEVVAEGVETQEQLEFLTDSNCDKLQGYFISRPLTLPGVVQFIESYRGLPRSR